MSYTFGNAVLDLAREITEVVESTATGDGAVGKTSLVDGSMPINTPADDWYNQGTIWFKSCTNTELNGKSAIITDFTNSSGTFVFAAAAAQTKSGDTYAVVTDEWPRFILRQAVNKALMDIGDTDDQNTATTTVTDQRYYSLPTDVYNVKLVEMARNLSEPYDYMELNHWREVNGQIQFRAGYQPDSTGYILRLTYNVPLAEITSDSTALPTLINHEWLKWASAVHAYRWRLKRSGDDKGTVKELLNEALAQTQRAERRRRAELRQTPQTLEHGVWDIQSGIDIQDSSPGHVRFRS